MAIVRTNKTLDKYKMMRERIIRYRNTNKVPYTCKNTEIKIGCHTIVKETGKFARNNYLKFTEESFMFASHVREVTSKKKKRILSFCHFFLF